MINTHGDTGSSSTAAVGTSFAATPVAKPDFEKLVDAVSERPLFIVSRTLPVLIMAEPEITNTEATSQVAQISDVTGQISDGLPSDVTLIGTISQLGQTRALFRLEQDGSEIWAAIGESIVGWRLVKISHSKVVLQRAEVEIAVQLYQ